jgi:hypothetical protein
MGRTLAGLRRMDERALRRRAGDPLDRGERAPRFLRL